MSSTCFFGIYTPSYSRNHILMKGLRACGTSITECCIDPRANPGILKYGRLFFLGLSLRKHHFDYIFVAFPGHTVTWLARLIWPRHVIVFDMFLSLRDANLEDRRVYSRYSWGSARDYVLDRLSSIFADVVLIDTDEQVDFLVRSIGIPRRKCVAVYVGTDPDLFFPAPPESDMPTSLRRFLIHFHGTFVPVHGTDIIIGAARILKDDRVQFRLVGTGQTYKRDIQAIKNLGLENIEVVPIRGYARMRSFIIQADICLGVFGKARRLDRVVPNKIFEYVACKKPVITAHSVAVRSCFGDTVRTCMPDSPEALAQEIRTLISHYAEGQQSATQAYGIYERAYTPAAIVSDLLDELRQKGIITI